MGPRSRSTTLTALAEFFRTEAAGGVLLVLATAVALVWANLDPTGYTDLWDQSLDVGIGGASLHLDLHHWVNDGVMAIFFFVVGLEIKRELVEGELRDPRTAVLPGVAAIGGMIVPALLYLAWNAGTPASDGWGIPMATDIAFAIGVLTLLGSRVSPALKLFVLTLAIVDDIGAIIVIALFYSDGIDTRWLVVAVAIVGATLALRYVTVQPLAYVPFALALWVCTYQSGVHATLAGVVLGLCTPTRTRTGSRPAATLEHRLHPVASFVAVPLFALANAGIVITTATLTDAATSPITWGVLTGLVVGKLVGIVGATYLARRIGIGRLPTGVSWRDVIGGAAVAGIGFTVSLFVAELSLAGGALGEAKLGVLIASIVATILAVAVLAFGPHARRAEPSNEGAPLH